MGLLQNKAAEKQLDTLINWCHCAELLAYNDDRTLIYLESLAR